VRAEGESVELLTVDEIAKLLKVTPITVRRYITDGRLPAVRVGRRVRVRKEAVEDLLSPIIPSRAGASAKGKRGHVNEIERATVRPLTDKEKREILATIEKAKRERAELAAKYHDVPVPFTLELLDEAREQRTRELT
jgi:excisionase family DNA binding protein